METGERVVAVRGATQVEENSRKSVSSRVIELVEQLVEQNGVTEDLIVSVVFSQTRDITAQNPAAALRTVGYANVPLFCTQEPEYDGSLPRMIRVLMTFRSDSSEPVPVYLNGAERLRSDLFDG